MFKSPFLNTKHNSEAIVWKSSAKNRNKKKKKKKKLQNSQENNFSRAFFKIKLQLYLKEIPVHVKLRN